MAKKNFYTITEAAKAKRVTRGMIHQAIKDGRLTAQWGTVEHVIKSRVLLIPAGNLKKLKIDKAQQSRGKKTSKPA